MTVLSDSLPSLHAALGAVPGYQDIPLSALSALPTSGLAHDHVTIAGTGTLLRVPRQSQMRLDAARNLAYQAACFQRMAAGGHTPRLHATLPPTEAVPMGALLVDWIDGRALQVPGDLAAAAEALASIHALPLPAPDERPPLIDQRDPMGETLAEVSVQADFLNRADLHPDSLAMIQSELSAATRDCAALETAPISLISFDAHPGNFLIDRTGRAVLVDLEKGRYGGAGFDLAHATLYTSTTWDVATYSEPTGAEVTAFYNAWRAAMPGALAASLEPFLMPMRRLMWLWSITWCAKWRVESQRDVLAAKHQSGNTEDWSSDNTDAALITHVKGRVDHYLTPEIIARVRQDWA